MAAVEYVTELQQIGLEGDDLLESQRPLLVPRARQAHRLVPGRQLHGARARVLRQHDGQHFQQNAVDVVFRLLFGEAQRIDLHAVAETPQFRILDAVPFAAQLVPQFREGPHLAHFGDEADARIDEKAHPPDDLRKRLRIEFVARPHLVEHRTGGRQGERQFLHRRRTGLLQMVRADVVGIPFRDFADGEGDNVAGQFQRRLGRKDIGAAGEVFLDDVVLHRALQDLAVGALPFRRRDVQRQEPRRRRVDRHRGIHVGQRNTVEQRFHIAEMADRHPDLTDLALSERVVGIVTGLRRQVESDRQAGLPARQIGAVQLVRRARRGMARISPENPRSVLLRRGMVHRFSPAFPALNGQIRNIITVKSKLSKEKVVLCVAKYIAAR